MTVRRCDQQLSPVFTGVFTGRLDVYAVEESVTFAIHTFKRVSAGYYSYIWACIDVWSISLSLASACETLGSECRNHLPPIVESTGGGLLARELKLSRLDSRERMLVLLAA